MRGSPLQLHCPGDEAARAEQISSLVLTLRVQV